MNDHLTMKAERELDRLIAERLGYSVRDEIIRNEAGYSHDYQLIDPDGKIYSSWNASAYGAWDNVPRYSTDLNAATELLSGVSSTMLVYATSGIGAGKWQADLDGCIRFADTLTLAICRAWLSWKDGSS